MYYQANANHLDMKYTYHNLLCADLSFPSVKETCLFLRFMASCSVSNCFLIWKSMSYCCSWSHVYSNYNLNPYLAPSLTSSMIKDSSVCLFLQHMAQWIISVDRYVLFIQWISWNITSAFTVSDVILIAHAWLNVTAFLQFHMLFKLTADIT